MARDSRRRNVVVALVLLIVLVLLLLLRCKPKEPAAPKSTPAPAAAAAPAPAVPAVAGEPRTAEPAEILTPATLDAPAEVTAGAAFTVAWTGPDNRGDYLTVVRADAPASASGSYVETKEGRSIALTAPIEPGAYELRYTTGRSHTVLGRAPLTVVAAAVTLDAAAEAVLGSRVSVAWTGPNNEGDYITLVPKELRDGQYGNYTVTAGGSPLIVIAPPAPGDAELRYMTGQGGKVLARRPVKIVMADVTLSTPDEALAGSRIEVRWTGPDNAGDYVTVVAAEAPDGQYGDYSVTSGGSPLSLLVPILAGRAEVRYVTGQGGRVLARRGFEVVAAEVTLSAPDEAAAGSMVTITWTGPDHPGDYITLVARDAADGQYGTYVNTSSGSPLDLKAPDAAGELEIRYMTGQGGKVLARRPLRIVR